MILIGWLAAATLPLAGQTVLQLERSGRVKTVKYGIGTVLDYRLNGQKEWYAGEIVRLIPDEKIIVFPNRYVRLEEMAGLRFDSPSRWSKPMGRNLYIFGASWSAFSLGASIFDKNDPYTWGDAAVTATAGATGWLIQRLFRYKTIRLNQRKRLRILLLG